MSEERTARDAVYPQHSRQWWWQVAGLLDAIEGTYDGTGRLDPAVRLAWRQGARYCRWRARRARPAPRRDA